MYPCLRNLTGVCGEVFTDTAHADLASVLGLTPGDTIEECCTLCQNTAGCVTYSLVPHESLQDQDVDHCLFYDTALGAGTAFGGINSAMIGALW